MSKILFLFTHEFPYGSKSEPFIETEILYLAKSFKKVIIFPSFKNYDSIRSLNENVEINNALLIPDNLNKIKVLIKNLIKIKDILKYSKINFNSFFLFIKFHRLYLDKLATSIYKAKQLRRLIKLNQYNLEDIVFYDYWFNNSTISLSILKESKIIDRFFSRAHRIDLYDELNQVGEVPFFNYRITHVFEVFCISKHGENYLKQKLKNELTEKVRLSYLGVQEQKQKSKLQVEPYVIVSCARIVEFKNVLKIPEVLKLISKPIKWVHFGDGPLFNQLKSKIDKLPKEISVQLMGHVENQKVLEFYSNNHVDLFISLSSSEGLPVSLMEALSFGIPIASIGVNGVPEIVNEKTGLLFNENDSIKKIANKIDFFLTYSKLNKEEIISFFYENFWAKKNYSSFIKLLLTDKSK